MRTKQMKPRHVAALALVAWFLMMPPVTPDTHRVDRRAGLSQWRIAGRFPRREGCAAARDRARDSGLAAHPPADLSKPGRIPAETCVRCAAECVEDGDPRLKSD